MSQTVALQVTHGLPSCADLTGAHANTSMGRARTELPEGRCRSVLSTQLQVGIFWGDERGVATEPGERRLRELAIDVLRVDATPRPSASDINPTAITSGGGDGATSVFQLF